MTTSEPTVFEQWLVDTEVCHFEFQISRGEDPEFEWCSEPSVACDLDSETGRCLAHCQDFEYLFAWGNIPKPKDPLNLVGLPPIIPIRDEDF